MFGGQQDNGMGNSDGTPPATDDTMTPTDNSTASVDSSAAPAFPAGDTYGSTDGATPAVMDTPVDDGTSTELPTPVDDNQTTATSTSASLDTDDLLSIKQQALQQLSPLVNHLDQSPEDKFRTTMMMIQASDDSSMLPQAYEAAQQISDEKFKAQALLDVVNEINYFTQHHDTQQ